MKTFEMLIGGLFLIALGIYFMLGRAFVLGGLPLLAGIVCLLLFKGELSQKREKERAAALPRRAESSAPAPDRKNADAPAAKPEPARPVEAAPAPAPVPREQPPDPFTVKIRKNVCFLLKTEWNEETYAYDRTTDTFYQLKRSGSEYGRPVRQEDMPLCYYIIRDDKEGSLLCLFGTGEASQLEHMIPDHDSFPPGPPTFEFAWGSFDHKPARLYVFSDGVRLVWRWLADLNDSAVRLPSAEFPKLADAVRKKNQEPHDVLNTLLDRQRALLGKEAMMAFNRWEPDYSGFTIRQLDMILYDISSLSEEVLPNEKVADVLELELQIMLQVTPTLRLARKNVLLVDVSNRDIHALADLMRDKSPGFALTDRDNFRCMWEDEPDFDHNDTPKFYWRDILTGKCFATYEKYEGWSYNGDEDYMRVLCAPCSQEEFEAALQAKDARPGP